MKKYVSDLKVVSVEHINDKYVLIKLTQDGALPEILPGQFVEVRVDGSPTTFLRRPISVNFVDYEANQLWLLVAAVGDGTRRLSRLQAGDVLNCMFPLGNSFTMPAGEGEKVLLVGGGVGVAPLLYFGKVLNDVGCRPVFLLGARSKKDLLMLGYTPAQVSAPYVKMVLVTNDTVLVVACVIMLVCRSLYLPMLASLGVTGGSVIVTVIVAILIMGAITAGSVYAIRRRIDILWRN